MSILKASDARLRGGYRRQTGMQACENAPSVKEKIFYNTGGRKPYVKKPVVTQQRIDQILDKINQKGFSSLSEDEKSILKKARETDF